MICFDIVKMCFDIGDAQNRVPTVGVSIVSSGTTAENFVASRTGGMEAMPFVVLKKVHPLGWTFLLFKIFGLANI